MIYNNDIHYQVFNGSEEFCSTQVEFLQQRCLDTFVHPLDESGSDNDHHDDSGGSGGGGSLITQSSI